MNNYVEDELGVLTVRERLFRDRVAEIRRSGWLDSTEIADIPTSRALKAQGSMTMTSNHLDGSLILPHAKMVKGMMSRGSLILVVSVVHCM